MYNILLKSIDFYNFHPLLTAIIAFLVWFVYSIIKSLYFFYIWQIKGFRVDRLRAEIRKNKRVAFPASSLVSLLILGFIIIPLYAGKIINNQEINLAILFGIIIFCYASYCLSYFFSSLKKLYGFPAKEEKRLPKIKLPNFTKKMTLLVLSFFSVIFLAGFFLIIKSPEGLIFFIILADIFAFFLVSLWALLFKIPNYFLRERKFYLARQKRKKFKNLIVAGIAGSYGKTSTKEFLAALLEKKFGKERVLKSEKNENTEAALADLLLEKLKPEHKFLIAEIGAYKRGEIKKAMSFLKPRIGILTGISFQHLDLFGSFENTRKAKSEIVFNLPENGLAVFNGSDKNVLEIAKNYKRKKVVYSLEKNELSNLWEEELKIEKDFLEFNMVLGQKKEKIRLNLFGKQNAENFLGAAYVANYLGLELEEISQFAPLIKPLPTSLKKKVLPSGLTIINDTYNMSYESIISAFEYLKLFSGKKIIFMPCLIEADKSFEEIYQKIGEEINKYPFEVFTTERKCFPILRKISGEKIHFSPSPEKAEKIKESLGKEDAILLEGRIDKKLIATFE